MPSTVVSPGFRLTASRAQQTQLRFKGQQIVHRMKPCYVSLMDPASLQKAGENLAHTSYCQTLLSQAHQSYRDVYVLFISHPSNIGICMIASLEKTTKTHSTLFRGAQNRCRRESKAMKQTLVFKRCWCRGLRRTGRKHTVSHPTAQHRTLQAHSSLFLSFI